MRYVTSINFWRSVVHSWWNSGLQSKVLAINFRQEQNYVSICPSVCVSIWLFVFLSVRLAVYWSDCPSVHLALSCSLPFLALYIVFLCLSFSLGILIGFSRFLGLMFVYLSLKHTSIFLKHLWIGYVNVVWEHFVPVLLYSMLFPGCGWEISPLPESFCLSRRSTAHIVRKVSLPFLYLAKDWGLSGPMENVVPMA